MRELPEDIWALVVAHLSQTDLTALVAVSRTLLQVVLDRRYRHFDWFVPDKKTLGRLLRLSDPFVAKRVKRMHVRESFMRHLLRNPQAFENPTPVVYGIVERLYSFISGVPPIGATTYMQLDGLEDRPRDIVCLLEQALLGMTNLREVTFESDSLVKYTDTLRLLGSFKRVFNPHLHTVTLNLTITDLSSLLPGVALPGLEEFDLTVKFDASAAQELLNNLGLTITAFAPNIHIFKIHSWAHQDHTQFLTSLAPFNNLRSLSVAIQFSKQRISDTSCLNQILRQHRITLHHLELLPESWDPKDKSQTSNWASFLEQCLLDLDQWPTNLKILAIPSTDLPTTMSLIRRVANTLTCLRLTYRYLTYLEVADVIDLFHHRPHDMQHLSLDVTLATPNLFGLLARKLPGLLSLTLVIEDAKSTMHSILRTRPDESDISWNLFDLSIFNKKFRDDSISIAAPMSFEFEEGLMAQLSYLLPSVRSFKGRGHIDMIRIC